MNQFVQQTYQIGNFTLKDDDIQGKKNLATVAMGGS